jgi:hypothetical protein
VAVTARRTSSRRLTAVATALAGTACSVLAACAGGGTAAGDGEADASGSPSGSSSTATPSGTPTATPTGGGDQQGEDPGDDGPEDYAVAAPGPLEPPLLKPDVLIRDAETLPREVVRGIRRVPGVRAALPLSIAAASVDGRTLTVAAVDAAQFRRFTPPGSARAQFVWKRLAGGEVTVDPAVDDKLVDRHGVLRLGTGGSAPEVHVGAYAPLVNQPDAGGGSRPVVQAVVNEPRGEQLGMPSGNALLVDTGEFTPSRLTERFEAVLAESAPEATLQVVALEFENAAQTAVLTGASVSDAVGHFSYTNGPSGTIVPDPGWVRSYIRTEDVPILGSVTCNKAMLPQLRGALAEIQRLGLAEKIHPDEYQGCYYPRYIGRDPSNGLSLHSWGIAVDLNVPGNQRGTVGEMDRTVVAVFKRWGFAWGGDWSYTDPMHFEMNAVVRGG